MSHAWTIQTVLLCGCSLVIQSANWTFSKYLSWSCNSIARIQRALAISPRNPPSTTVVRDRMGGAFLSGSTRVSPRSPRNRVSVRCAQEAPTNSATASPASPALYQCERERGIASLSPAP